MAVHDGTLLHFAFVAAAIVVSVATAVRRRNAQRVHWATITRQKEWRVVSSDGATLEAAIGDALVILRRIEDDSAPSVQVSAAADAPPDFALVVRRKGELGVFSVKTSIGEPFDSAFDLESNDPALAKAWFHRKLRRAFRVVAATKGSFRLELKDGTVTANATWPGATSDSLSKLAELVAAVARSGDAIVAGWQRLSHELDGKPIKKSPFPPPPIVFSRPGCLAQLELAHDAGAWKTVLTLTATQQTDTGKQRHREELVGLVFERAPVLAAIADAWKALGGSTSTPYR